MATINWDIPQKVKSSINNVVIDTTGEHNEYSFSGTMIQGGMIGHFAKNWKKKWFEPLTGESL